MSTPALTSGRARRRTRPGDWAGPVAIVLGVIAAAAIGGLATAPSTGWLNGLQQPGWAPPDSLFGPVWTALYVLIAASLSWTWLRTPAGERRPLGLLAAANLGLNLAWTVVFFQLRSPLAAAMEIVVLELTTLALIALAWRRSRPAAVALVPYGLWVGFATVLTWSIWALNR